ncbi:histidinol-phosphate aminotransferase 1 [Spirochaetia bacterium]|nr:histidinol-phosphate aminotransferase 1 [Spirochaetia bacterium]
MSKYWNSRIKGLSPYIPGEQPRERKFIKLNTNENPYPPSPKVIEAIQYVLAQGGGGNAYTGARLRLYPDPACTELREAIAMMYQVKPAQVFAGNGSDEVLAFAFGAFFENGGRPILFPDITYTFYPVYSSLWALESKNPPLTDDFSIRTEDYRVKSGGVILANPNAPTGRALSAEDVMSIVQYEENGDRNFVIVDEAYNAFGTESVVKHIGKNPNLLTIHTLSKSASLAGLRVGFAIGNEDLIEALCRIRDSFNSYTLGALAQAGATAAMSDTAYYSGINKKIIATRERVSAELSGMGFEVIPSKTNFIFARYPEKSGAETFTALRERGILVRRFNLPRISDFLRISIGTNDDMDRFLDSCRDIININENH